MRERQGERRQGIRDVWRHVLALLLLLGPYPTAYVVLWSNAVAPSGNDRAPQRGISTVSGTSKLQRSKLGKAKRHMDRLHA